MSQDATIEVNGYPVQQETEKKTRELADSITPAVAGEAS
jgi:hypothetical protein